MPQVALFASEDIEAFTELCFGALPISTCKPFRAFRRRLTYLLSLYRAADYGPTSEFSKVRSRKISYKAREAMQARKGSKRESRRPGAWWSSRLTI